MDKDTNTDAEQLTKEHAAKQQEAKELFAKAEELQKQARVLLKQAEQATVDAHKAVMDSYTLKKRLEQVAPEATTTEQSDCIVDDSFHTTNTRSIYFGNPEPVRVCDYHDNHPSIVMLRREAERKFGHVVFD